MLNPWSIKCVKIEKDKIVEVYGDYQFSERLELNEKRLMFDIQPDDIPESEKLQARDRNQYIDIENFNQYS